MKQMTSDILQFELLYGNLIQGPMKILKQLLFCSSARIYVSFSHKRLTQAQVTQAMCYDKKTKMKHLDVVTNDKITR